LNTNKMGTENVQLGSGMFVLFYFMSTKLPYLQDSRH
jgi:hypothetical protein